ncbi:MAG: hypothetical protein AB8B64_21220 [Granulosicoccus sp.]
MRDEYDTGWVGVFILPIGLPLAGYVFKNSGQQYVLYDFDIDIKDKIQGEAAHK